MPEEPHLNLAEAVNEQRSFWVWFCYLCYFKTTLTSARRVSAAAYPHQILQAGLKDGASGSPDCNFTLNNYFPVKSVSVYMDICTMCSSQESRFIESLLETHSSNAYFGAIIED